MEELDWDPPLKHKRGGRRRLGGLDVFYDFDWKQVFSHNRAVFPNGQSLASLVSRECPDGLSPTLLLTERDDVEAGIRELENRYVVIVPINEYLAGAGADAASTFYARLAGKPLTQLASLSDAAFTEAELGQFLLENLDETRLRRWAEAASDNRATVTAIAEKSRGDLGTVLALVEALKALDHAEWAQVGARLDETGDTAQQMLRALTVSTHGREATTAVLGSRLDERIADVREQLTRYRELVAGHDVTETQVQEFIEHHPWIVGLAYVRARPRMQIPRGEIDFVLDRFDGFFDILELKGPSETIVAELSASADRPASASAYSLGVSLSKAIAQSHLYRSNLERSRSLASQYGLADTRQPRVMILVGRSADLSETGREILRQLNLSLHRVEILPYDVLGERTEGWLRNIEELLDVREPTED